MTKPRVGVVRGSASYWDVMCHAVDQLENFGLPHEVQVVSVHRTPDLLFKYAVQTEPRGHACSIAGGTVHFSAYFVKLRDFRAQLCYRPKRSAMTTSFMSRRRPYLDPLNHIQVVPLKRCRDESLPQEEREHWPNPLLRSIRAVLDNMKALRSKDEMFYLLSATFNIFNGTVGLYLLRRWFSLSSL